MIAAFAILGLVWLSPQDIFVARRDAAAARNPQSSRFTIAFPDERRVFHPGEAIPIVFSYDDLSISGFNYESWPHLGAADAVLDHADGTTDPLADFYRAAIYVPGGIFGGVRGGLIGAGGRRIQPPPETFTVFLNQGLRFDSPGHYRLYVSDQHHSLLERAHGRPTSPPLISNIVEFDITPRHPA